VPGAQVSEPDQLRQQVDIERQGGEVAELVTGEADVVQHMVIELVERLERALEHPVPDHAAQLRKGECAIPGDGLRQNVVTHDALHCLDCISQST
jgi:hypothetical protein